MTTPQNTCRKKITYPSYTLAKQYMAVYYATMKTKLEPYKCPHGNHWHLKGLDK